MIDMNIVETERLVLRKLTKDDSLDVFKILSDSETVKYLNLDAVNNVDDVIKLIEEYLNGYKEGNKFPFAIVDKNTNNFIGVFLIKLDIFDDDCFEFTVYIDKEFWNKGVYTEVLPKMIQFAFENIETGNFRGFVMKNNTASAKVLLKNNFKLEKSFTVEGLPEEIESYLMTKNFYYSNYR